jgi:hypothetical protein
VTAAGAGGIAKKAVCVIAWLAASRFMALTSS